MKVLKLLLIVFASFIVSLGGGVLAGSAYQRWRYPGVQDTDGLLDIGAVYFAGFALVAIGITAFFAMRYFRRARA